MSSRVRYFFPLLRSVFANRGSNSAKALRRFTSLLLYERFLLCSIRRFAALATTTTMLFVTLPPAVAGQAARDAVHNSGEIAKGARGWTSLWSPKLLRWSLPVITTVFGERAALAIFDSK